MITVLHHSELSDSFTGRVCAVLHDHTFLATLHERQAKNCPYWTASFHSLGLHSGSIFLCNHSIVTDADANGFCTTSFKESYIQTALATFKETPC